MSVGAVMDDDAMSCCGNCCFSFDYQSRNRMLIECRRFPPTLCHYDAETDTSSWEFCCVQKHHWCGEWRRKAKL